LSEQETALRGRGTPESMARGLLVLETPWDNELASALSVGPFLRGGVPWWGWDAEPSIGASAYGNHTTTAAFLRKAHAAFVAGYARDAASEESIAY
jgi:hypothetical protein